MTWLNVFAGGTAFQRAENLAEEHNGFSVDAGDYKGIRPALAVYSEVEDLLKSGHRWSDITDNFLPLTWEEYRDKYLTRVKKDGCEYLVRVFECKWTGYRLVTEESIPPKNTSDWLIHCHYSQPESIDELSLEDKQTVFTKFNEVMRREAILQ